LSFTRNFGVGFCFSREITPPFNDTHWHSQSEAPQKLVNFGAKQSLAPRHAKRYHQSKVIFVNFKTYQKGTGEEALELAKICQAVARESGLEIIAVVQAADIWRLTQALSLPVWAQHLDAIEYGPHTGQILPEAAAAAGAKGTLLNHSENQLPVEVIKETIERCQKLKLKVLVCAKSLGEAQEIVEAKPDLIAFEPPELIGSQTISVSTAKPEIIKDFVRDVKDIPILVGAGVHSREDVRMALSLGAVGFLVATDVVLAKDPKRELLDLTRGFNKSLP
jgi:triosephosphate isomerase